MKRMMLANSIRNNSTLAAWIILACFLSALIPVTLKSQILPSSPDLLPRQTATRLADGRVLLLGGESSGRSLETSSIWDPRTNTATHLPSRLNAGRAWHTATVLPDGMIAIFGGVGNGNEMVVTAELFDPVTQAFSNLPS